MVIILKEENIQKHLMYSILGILKKVFISYYTG